MSKMHVKGNMATLHWSEAADVSAYFEVRNVIVKQQFSVANTFGRSDKDERNL